MKTSKILLAAAVVATFTVANRLNAADSYLSPRAAEQRSQIIAGTNNDPNLAANRDFSVPPKTLDLRTKVANGTSNDPDLLAASRNYAGTPKSLDFPSAAAFQVAPVK